ncbi:head decoration protein [Diaphorobacter sp. JS3050]|uniref:head decoration protein n=1 Tax=Diaphorobacter sp. JS3050 TaxID=2735554 RepID=UPI001C13268B
MSTPLISPSTLGDLIKRESDPDYTRETVTLKAGTAYPLGAVLGRITADGKYTFSPVASTTGTEGPRLPTPCCCTRWLPAQLTPRRWCSHVAR